MAQMKTIHQAAKELKGAPYSSRPIWPFTHLYFSQLTTIEYVYIVNVICVYYETYVCFSHTDMYLIFTTEKLYDYETFFTTYRMKHSCVSSILQPTEHLIY